MDRRLFLETISAAALVSLLRPAAAAGQDPEFVAAVERAQKERPATLSSVARIAPASEPGEPLVVHGRVVAEDGKSPVGGAIVFAYHTDRAGLYDRPGSPPHRWRLKGWARTAADGTFRFDTIRPGAYPNRNIPQHIHVQLLHADGRRYWSDELRFADDPLVPAAERDLTCRVRREGGVQHVDYTVRINPANRFEAESSLHRHD
jgi:protocatechuate 3,4-dioxygenase beta subunit